MKLLLLVLVLVAGGAAGYEYSQQSQQAADYVEKRGELAASIARLKTANKDLTDEQAVLSEKLTNLQKDDATLKAQIDDVRKATTSLSTNFPASAGAPNPAPAH